MPTLDRADKLKLLRTMLVSRLGDLREQSLIRQGQGWFHVSGMGHEALAVAGYLLQDGDYFAGYYRDRPIALGRGVSSYDLALSFFAKKASANGGRQMPAHYSDPEKGIFSIASVVAASLVPACGLAWGLKLDGKPGVVLTTVGDAGTRQGDFYESVAFALEKQLPMLFVVEDNGIGISSVTTEINPLALGVFDRSQWQTIDACDADAVFQAVQPALAKIRAGEGPQFLWCRTERISSHSSADDQRKYRPEDELAQLDEKDPINRLKAAMLAAGELTEADYDALFAEVDQQVRQEFARAQQEADPDAADALDHVFGPPAQVPALEADYGEKTRMVDAINQTFHEALETSDDFVFFGQDIEDPKGGVFSFTKGLSSAHPGNVFNSPLAESTILGVAVGLAAYGKRPVFEIQFTDYIWAGFNQFATHFSTLHWRTNGQWKAPAVIYAPYGAYLPGGALWHSQANEAILAHFPGVQLAIPSTAEDAAGLFWAAMHANSPTFVLIPKHLMWHPREMPTEVVPVPFGKARVMREGTDLTIVTWGNGTEVVEKALTQMGDELDPEVLDLRTVNPLDHAGVAASVRRTGRLLVVQEDAESCSVGQNLIARLVKDPALFGQLIAPPTLLAKPDVNIGYHPNLEYGVLPSAEDVVSAAKKLCARSYQRDESAAAFASPEAETISTAPALRAMQASMTEESAHEPIETTTLREVRVPILGEGITSARVMELVAEPGQKISQDDPLCEVETDKAMFPIEAPFDGVFRNWKIEEEVEVEVDQLICEIEVEAENAPPPTAQSAGPAPETTKPIATPPSSSDEPRPFFEGGLPPRIVAQLNDVIPTHMTVKAGWDALAAARAEAKAALGKEAPSPTLMLAWSIVRALEKHPIFTCTVPEGTRLQPREIFDFGVAVALPHDALDTAVIPQANRLDWPAFCAAYEASVADVRAGRSPRKSGVPFILTSLGGFRVRDAQPIVVPPAIATLFVGEAHYDLTADGTPRPCVNLNLSFDHRWLNGAAGASFLHDIRAEMENFTLPTVRA